MTQSLSENQMQTLLQYLYNDRDEVRFAAIQQSVKAQWQHEQLTQALEELAALDEAGDVRAAAREALRELEASAV